MDHDGRSVLTVAFTSGRLYAFAGVPARVYEDFLAAPSKGIFFNDEIRDRYDVAEITVPPARAR